MAERGVRLVYGGRRVGLMGAVANAVLTGGGEAVGVIPEFILQHERENPGRGELAMGLADDNAIAPQSEVPDFELTEVVVVADMQERKQRMFELSDAFVALPGGLGTLEEAVEIITWKKLQIHAKPVAMLNTDGYWEPFRALVRRTIDAGFAHPASRELFSLVDTPEEVFDALAAAPEPNEEVLTSHL